jgi:hypothetical protein
MRCESFQREAKKASAEWEGRSLDEEAEAGYA